MSERSGVTGFIVISHGSPREAANETFRRLVERIASRLDPIPVRPAFFSLVPPTIEDQVAGFVAEGVRTLSLVPYFLHEGQHIAQDIPQQLAACRARFPGVSLQLLATLQNDPRIEDLVVERMFGSLPASEPSRMDGLAIERKSWAIIDRRLDLGDLRGVQRDLVRRVIHATADFGFAESLRFHPDAIAAGVAILRGPGSVLCDVNMLKVGITRVHGRALCAIADPDVLDLSRERQTTRAAMAMEKLSERFPESIVAVGNAPTALWQVLEIARRGGPRPGLVVGVPVGFVDARESKRALMQSDLRYISNEGASGGTPVAAALINGLALLAQQKGGPSCANP